MQMFGLISLIITITIAALWLTSSLSGSTQTINEDGTTSGSTYQESINAAEDAAALMGN